MLAKRQTLSAANRASDLASIGEAFQSSSLWLLSWRSDAVNAKPSFLPIVYRLNHRYTN